MSESCFAGPGTDAVHGFTSEYLVQTEEACAPTEAVPSALEGREAEAVRGALSFLFLLIASYDELIELDALASDSAGCEDSSLH